MSLDMSDNGNDDVNDIKNWISGPGAPFVAVVAALAVIVFVINVLAG